MKKQTFPIKKLMLCISSALYCNIAFAQQSSASADFAQPMAGVNISQPTAGANFAQLSTNTNPTPVSDAPKKHHFFKNKHKKQAVAKPADPLAVHPDVALKNTLQKEIFLPGVMKIAGGNAAAMDFSRSRVLEVSNAGSKTIYLSATDQNRIQVPWINPKIVGTTELTIDKHPDSNNIYVQFKEGVTRPVQIYIEQSTGGGPVLGLQLIPKTIPAQTILLRDVSDLTGDSIKAPHSDDNVSQTQSIMETVALGGSPEGFTQIELKLGPIVKNGLVINPEKLFSSVDREIYVYDVTNPANSVVTLQEKEFDGPTVLAISIFPKPLLVFNEHVKVIVIVRKLKESEHGS